MVKFVSKDGEGKNIPTREGNGKFGRRHFSGPHHNGRTEDVNTRTKMIPNMYARMANGCTYCVAAHSTIADMNMGPAEVTDAVRDGKPLPDARLDALSTFTAAVVDNRGLPTAAQTEAFLAAGYPETDILQIVPAVSVKTISNYANHLFHTPVGTGNGRALVRLRRVRPPRRTSRTALTRAGWYRSGAGGPSWSRRAPPDGQVSS